MRLMILLRLLFQSAFIFMGIPGLHSEEDPRYKRISDALNKFTYAYPQQKVYLHLDKNTYWGGDMLWIKAYLLNGMDHLPDTLSTNLYVEIISPARTRVEIKRLQMFNGFGIGDFTLSDTLPEGLYQIRAFTAWMQNFATDYYFEKNFQVLNPKYRKLITPKQARMNIEHMEDLNKDAAEIDLQFMPEGGYLVNGLVSVVAFKAVNQFGKGVDISGAVYDENGKKAAEFKTLYKGLGKFNFKPEAERKYTAIFSYQNNELKLPLPKALDEGIVMKAEHQKDKIRVLFESNRPATDDPTANEIIVTGQIGGRIYYHEIIRLKDNKASAEFPRHIIPGGILQITAFSGRGVPFAERLMFTNNSGYMNVQFIASDSVAEDGNKVILSINVKDKYNKPLAANLSVSITRDVEGLPDYNKDNILSNILLHSDLKGFIEDPLDYFSLPRFEISEELDNLMLTQGWRRFDWNSILAGEYPQIKYREEKGITIAGKITRDFFGIPIDNAKVRLSIMSEFNDVFTEYTADKGQFVFDSLVYYDTVSVKIEAWKPSGRKNLQILLQESKEENVVAYEGEYVLTTFSDMGKKEYRKLRYEEGKELAEREKEALEKRRANSLTGIYGEPDFVLYSEDFSTNTGNVLDVIKGRVPGVQVTGDNVVIRGINTIYGSTQPLYLLDGTPVSDVGAITAIPIEDIERVEVLKGPKTSFYGARGANGVIAVFTKRGQFMIRGRIEFDMLGYSTPRVFYQPKFTPENEPLTGYTLLWESVVITDTTGRAKVVFDKPELPGNYRFDVQGISYQGHAGYADAVIANL